MKKLLILRHWLLQYKRHQASHSHNATTQTTTRDNLGPSDNQEPQPKTTRGRIISSATMINKTSRPGVDNKWDFLLHHTIHETIPEIFKSSLFCATQGSTDKHLITNALQWDKTSKTPQPIDLFRHRCVPQIRNPYLPRALVASKYPSTLIYPSEIWPPTTW